MNRRLTHILVTLVTAVVLVATLVFGLAVTPSRRAGGEARAARPAIPLIAHPANPSLAECRRCHVAGRGTPLSHAGYGPGTCRTCHRVASADQLRRHPAAAGGTEAVPRPVPHPMAAPYDDCAACHAIGGNLGMPESHAGYAGCHAASAAN
jgi:hypothetical protein